MYIFPNSDMPDVDTKKEKKEKKNMLLEEFRI